MSRFQQHSPLILLAGLTGCAEEGRKHSSDGDPITIDWQRDTFIWRLRIAERTQTEEVAVNMDDVAAGGVTDLGEVWSSDVILDVNCGIRLCARCG